MGGRAVRREALCGRANGGKRGVVWAGERLEERGSRRARDEKRSVVWAGEWRTTCGWTSGKKAGCWMSERAGNRTCEQVGE